MAITEQDEVLTEQQAAPQAEPAAEAAAEPAEEELEQPAPEEVPEPKKRRSILLPLLTILLVLLGLGEAGFWGLFGLSAYRNSLARERYEAQQRALEEERAARGITGNSSYGPNYKVENGTITWQREDDRLLTGSGTSAGGPSLTQGNSEEKRLSSLSVPNIPYTLAKEDQNILLPSSEQSPEGAEDNAAPTST